jgi:CRP-like cAMP-binding protein
MLSVESLKEVSLFRGIAQDIVEELWALGRVVHYVEGDKLFDRGHEADDVLIVESGSMALFFPVPILGAVKEVVVEHAGPGDVMAWSALVSPHALTLSARCVESGAVRALARNTLSDYLKDRPQVGYQLMRNLAGVIGRRLQDLQNMWIREIEARFVGP